MGFRSVLQYLSCGGRWQHIASNGQAVALLQNFPDLLVETHGHSVDGSIQTPPAQPLALPLLPRQLRVQGASRRQDAAGSRWAATSLHVEVNVWEKYTKRFFFFHVIKMN